MSRKNQKKDSQHHRRCRSNGGDDSPSNIIWVNRFYHRAWHLLFRNWRADKIAQVINDVWIDPEYEFIVVKRRRPRISK